MIYLVDIPHGYDDEPMMQNLELAYVASDLLENGYKVRIIDGRGIHRKLSLDEMAAELLRETPQFVCFYTKDITYNLVINWIKELKKHFCFFAVLLGPKVVLTSSNILEEHAEVDYVVCGDSIKKLSRVLDGDLSVQGIGYREGIKICINESQTEKVNLDTYPIPIRELGGTIFLTRTERLNGERFIVPIRSSKGCSYNCAFCTVPIQSRMNDIRWTVRSKANLLQEITRVYDKYGRVEIRFMDENFCEDIERMLDLAKQISDIGDIEFSFTARVSTLIQMDDSMFTSLYKYGVRGIEIGIENFNDNVLRRYRKGHTCQDAILAIHKVRKSGISLGVDFIMFDPWTTLEELKHNLWIIEKEGLDTNANAMLYNRLYPFEGTQYKTIIDLQNYFVNPDVEKIYDKLKAFKSELQIVRANISEKKKMLSSIVLLKAPYKLLGELVNEPGKPLIECQVYRTVKKLVDYK